MFWNKKNTSKEKTENKNEEELTQTIHRNEIYHIKSIIDGKLYDTEKSTMISKTQDGRFLFFTGKGNYFSCVRKEEQHTFGAINGVFYVTVITHLDIRPESVEYAKENIGRYEPDKYIELFGEVEEA